VSLGSPQVLADHYGTWFMKIWNLHYKANKTDWKERARRTIVHVTKMTSRSKRHSVIQLSVQTTPHGGEGDGSGSVQRRGVISKGQIHRHGFT
jgi:hypothetical protein